MKPLGIWGLGVVGQSVARYCLAHSIPVTLLNDRPLTQDQQKFLQEHDLSCLQGMESIEPFLMQHERILVSAGIDLRTYQQHAHKFLGELDLFAQEWHKPFIAITGTVGKTTVTHVLGHVLNHFGKKVAIGGNIGVGLCDILLRPIRQAQGQDDQEAESAILEVSSFQLELSGSFAADLAIWTNFSANHIDRHGTLEAYRDAKNNLITMQHAGQKALVPLSLRDEIKKGAGDIFYFTDNPSFVAELRSKGLPSNGFEESTRAFYFDHNQLRCNYATIAHIDAHPETLLRENWLIIASALHLLGLTEHINGAAAFIDALAKPEHRLELIGNVGGKLFYNDSKATTPTATNAALQQFKDKSVTLIIGGVSKGVDRSPFMQSLPKNISHVICFGSEANDLAAACTLPNVSICASLEEVVKIAHEKSAPGEIILFSPAGASYDLFTNYVERGNLFKKLVNNQSH
jgi:UDP-N-acetylmuramoylalanine--D-glutamate ligase